jgi:hypothetical protein
LGVIIVAMILIFLDGVGWLGPLWEYATGSWDSSLMGTVMLFIVVVGFIWWITGNPDSETKKS